MKVVDQGVDYDFGTDGYQWFYPYKDNFLIIVNDDLYTKQTFWDNNRTAIFYLIENDIWPNGKLVDKPLLEVLISSSGIPVSPIEKVDEILYYLKKSSDFLGHFISIREDWDYNRGFLRRIGLKYDDELISLINESKVKGWINEKETQPAYIAISLTLDGWERASKISKSSDSKIAFVAMSFDPEMVQIYSEWIEPAISESGFKPHIVLDQHPASDVTINDAIISGIKKANFTIADFTHHKAGVYFEAGYALGKGQKVIYTCREDQIGTAHFDTRNYQHLVWKDGEDLKKKLVDKIEVFIKS
ncbi:hypothetical protein [Lunatibacter salilacus]|uniref:hypothetical protein n=1 Tax=Lunatibacter salilacus TaxID=2483804 RepID=UPI00131E6646|nr:hypothetical protein [Lunatibacter salilacus]